MAFFRTENTPYGRLGEFSFEPKDVVPFETPYLFPVTFLMTGTTAKGGGVWRYTLRSNEHGLMKKNTAILSETLHFLDYHLNEAQLQKWRDRTIRSRYQNEAGVPFKGAIFLDSGGFRLMWRSGLDLSKYGLELTPDKEAQSVLQLQLDLGANIVASLDYPLPPGLSDKEQEARMERSRANAIEVAKLLKDHPSPPFLYMAVHGQTPERIAGYVTQLFKDIDENGLGDVNFGIAIGSLVPLRSNGQMELIIQLVMSAVKAIPEHYKARVPVHVFGLSGLLIPFLVYCGVDTFDSSTYMQEARSLKYTDHETRQPHRILEMPLNQFNCDCEICQQVDLREMQNALVAKTNNKPLANGEYKSKYYADIALHNLKADLFIVERTQQAIKEGKLDEYLVELAVEYPQMQKALQPLINDNTCLHDIATQAGLRFPLPARLPKKVKPISLLHTPNDFNVNNGMAYQAPTRPILLIIPCSAEKPYSDSTSHRFVMKHIQEVIPDFDAYIHKVSLSGLYGPVPQECETKTAVSEYDFLLKPENKAQIALCTERLVEYLNKYGHHYQTHIAYGTSKAYRMVFENAAKQFSDLQVLPNPLSAKTSREFFRISHIEMLVDLLKSSIREKVDKD